MKLTVENLGPIKEGSISFDKPLTLMVGPNGTGKSYVSYLVYGVENIDPNSDSEIVEEYIQIVEDEVFYDFQRLFRKTEQYTNEVLTLNKNDFYYNVFSSKDIKPIVQFDFSDVPEINREKIFNISDLDAEKISEIANEDTFLSVLIKIAGLFDDDFKKNDLLIKRIGWIEAVNLLERRYFSQYARKLSKEIWFLPAERTALGMISHDEVERKSKVFDQIKSLIQQNKTEKLKAFAQLDNNKYPKAINDYIYFINDLVDLRKNEGKFRALAAEIEEMLLDGKISVSEYGAIQYQPKGVNQTLDIHLSSSLVKSMSGLVLYLRHKATEADTIIIDEPEINLHPNNQRIVARVLTKLIRHGFKLIVSTHSDYIIQELNNLLMLGNIYENETRRDRFLADHGDKGYDQETFLTKDDIEVYYFNDSTIKELELTEFGFEVPSITNTIEDMNAISDQYFESMNEEA